MLANNLTSAVGAPYGRPLALATVGIVSAVLYGAGIELGAEALARTSFWLLYAEEDRYRLFARNMTDVITRHGKNRAIVFISPAAEALFGIADLQGGLFSRVHVADRPAYLSAIAASAILGETQSVEFRVRCDRRRRSAGNSSGSKCAAGRSTN